MTKSNYLKLHYWIRKNLGIATYCSNNRKHIAKRYHWANISGKYKKDLSDYKPLCPSCHGKMDYTEKRRQKVLGNTNRRMSIKKINKNGKLIKIYSSIKKASIDNQISRTAIINCLKKRSKTSGGYIWQYHLTNL